MRFVNRYELINIVARNDKEEARMDGVGVSIANSKTEVQSINDIIINN